MKRVVDAVRRRWEVAVLAVVGVGGFVALDDTTDRLTWALVVVTIGDYPFVRVTNVGPGAALAVDAVLTFERSTVKGTPPHEEPVLSERVLV